MQDSSRFRFAISICFASKSSHPSSFASSSSELRVLSLLRFWSAIGDAKERGLGERGSKMLLPPQKNLVCSFRVPQAWGPILRGPEAVLWRFFLFSTISLACLIRHRRSIFCPCEFTSWATKRRFSRTWEGSIHPESGAGVCLASSSLSSHGSSSESRARSRFWKETSWDTSSSVVSDTGLAVCRKERLEARLIPVAWSASTWTCSSPASIPWFFACARFSLKIREDLFSGFFPEKRRNISRVLCRRTCTRAEGQRASLLNSREPTSEKAGCR